MVADIILGEMANKLGAVMVKVLCSASASAK